MRKFLIILHIIAVIPCTSGQAGFKNVFDFNEAGLAFSSITYNGDQTVTLYGNLINQDLEYGLLFATFDTSGSLLNYQVKYDSLGDAPTLNYPNSFIKLADGSGFAAIGTFFFREKGFLIIYNNDGSVRNFTEYENSDVLAPFYIEITEVSDGFFILGDKQLQDGYTRIFLIKTDKNGNQLWEKRYGMPPPRENGYGSIVKVNDNEYVIGGASTTIPTSPQIVYNTSNFFVIDSLGNLKSSWASQPSTTDLGVGFGLYKTVNGGFIYATNELQFEPPQNVYERKLKVIERDSAYNILNEKSYGQFSTSNLLRNFKKLNDGSFLVLGQRAIKKTPPPPFTYTGLLMGSLLKVTPSGDSSWNYLDTAFTFASNLLYDATELPSSSIIACGFSRTTNPLKDWAWLVKVNKNGCVDTLNCVTVSSFTNPTATKKPIIYPNPACDFVQVDFPVDFDIGPNIFACLVSNTGSIIIEKKISASQNQLQLSDVKPGMYHLIIRRGKEIIGSKRIIIQN